MRICLLSREYPPDTGWGGIGAYTFQHARALKELGHDVEVISLNPRDRLDEKKCSTEDENGVPVNRASWSSLFQELSTLWISVPYSYYVLQCAASLWRKFVEVHSKNPFDVVEAPEHLAEGLFPALTRCCPLVVRLHTPHSLFVEKGYHQLKSSFDNSLVSNLERMAILQADLVNSPSKDLAGFVSRDTGMEITDIKILHNPVDTDRFTPDGKKAITSDAKINILFAGRLEERKGVQVLIESMPAIIEKNPDVQLILVGSDTDTGPGGSSVREALSARARELGIQDRVRFVGKVPLTEMPDYYRSADICVVPSLYENAPYTVLEAMSCGKPVVGSAAGGTPEYVADGETGFIVPTGDAKELAGAISKLVSNPGLRSEFARKARSRALQFFERRVLAGSAVELYSLAIERSQKRNHEAIYRRQPERALDDLVELLQSYHENLCELIAVHSFSFRTKRWLQFARRRPRLHLARVAHSLANSAAGISGLNSARLNALIEKLGESLERKEAERKSELLESLKKQLSTESPTR